MAAEGERAAASDAGAGGSGEAEEEVEYVFVSLEGVDHAEHDLASARELVLEGLLTENPKVTLAGVRYVRAAEIPSARGP